ncbi:MAG: sugar phosphate nucleotidyltransferase [Candidatus Binatia bacterium]
MTDMAINKGKLWGIVLAAGEGTRVRDFLRQLCGGRGIKQFCAVIGHRSLLEHTLARVERLIPRERILVIVSTDHQEEASRQLAQWPAENVIYQPANRDTTPGILLPLAHLSRREPFATVAIFPSDHFIVDEDRFMATVSQAVAETQRFPRELTLVGMPPDRAEEGYGWIEPGEKEEWRKTLPVRQFWEKPDLPQTKQLVKRGAVWNTFVCVVQATTLWEMMRQVAPDLYRDFMAIRRALGGPQAASVTEYIYRTVRAVNFSSGVCEALPSRLRVLPAPAVGWSDWGSVDRIVTSLKQLGKLNDFLTRLRHQGKAPPAPRDARERKWSDDSLP